IRRRRRSVTSAARSLSSRGKRRTRRRPSRRPPDSNHRTTLKRVLMAAAVLATVVAIFVSTRLPPKHQVLQRTFDDGTVAGVVHIHSVRSDGRGTPGQIAHAAALAGLKFIVLTDHGDATRTPDPPVYREGVLCLD